jgi:hypothetical protein
MKNMCFCATWAEKTAGVCDWEFVSRNRSRWESFYTGKDSIELQIKADPRLVVNDIEYSVYRYNVVEDPDNDENIRLMILYPVKQSTAT